jgi:hypothetical protein
MNKLEYRMYGLVPYNLSPIQQGIQYGHAVVEYSLENFQDQRYLDWAKYHKTFIILNGGTTNKRANIVTGEYVGSLNNHVESLKNAGVRFATFEEPDLGDQLTAVVFLVDERVFNTKDYPDFSDYIKRFPEIISTFEDKSLSQIARHLEEQRPQVYTNWVEDVLGGETNEFLRKFLKGFRLA